MQTVEVPLGERSYWVYISSGLLREVGVFCAGKFTGHRCAVVSDSNVWPLYGKVVEKSLTAAGIEPLPYILPAGEESKSLESFGSLLEFCAESELTGGDFLLALGGGVVGDLTGFAAASYRRGMPFVQVPTTLLAAVDSSVGGKTAVNLRAGKNLAGAFHQPAFVFCDITTLKTLPPAEYANGLAECIKHGILFDPDLFAALENGSFTDNSEKWIARNVELKRNVVVRDERESGDRKLLNLGHTLGHAIEAVSNFSIPHGAAVSIGICLICQWAVEWGDLNMAVSERIWNTLKKYGLPTKLPYPLRTLFTALAQDKKRSGNMLTVVSPEDIGKCSLQKISLEDFYHQLSMPF
ncbi:MAG: 3-dehydroquinate synthase [Oscillospiraceae bacterium]|jgi:3-dehydroquinate synthase|nr:3-dehydroquinate synthase [Oscillospiraceae bacterium]